MGKFYVQKYTIPTNNIKRRIILLTDIHYQGKKEQSTLLALLEILKQMEYDDLCISGDLLDSSDIEEEEFLITFFTSLGKLSKVFIGIGNHELTNDRKNSHYSFPKEFYQKLGKIANVHVLDNNTFLEGQVRFIGLTLPLDFYYRYHEKTSYFIHYTNQVFSKSLDGYNILLCHTPSPFIDNEIFSSVPFLENISLILSGHFHGGMTPRLLRPLLKGRGVVGPFHRLFPPFSYGAFKKKNSYVVISSGITKLSEVQVISSLDFLFQKEITLLSLEPKK